MRSLARDLVGLLLITILTACTAERISQVKPVGDTLENTPARIEASDVGITSKMSDSVTIKSEEYQQFAQKLFSENCDSCHVLAGGLGNSADSQNSAERFWKFGGSPEDIKKSITNGRKSLPSPPHKSIFSEEQLDQLVSYVLSLSGQETDNTNMTSGKILFDNACAACHRGTGKGNRALNAPDLTDNVWQYGSSEQAVKMSIRDGRKSVMPAFNEILDKDSIDELVSYVIDNGLSLKSDEDQIDHVFEVYRQGLKQRQVKKIYASVDQKTKDIYKELLHDALNLNKNTLKKRSTMNRFEILYLRHKYNSEELSKMTGYEVFSDIYSNESIETNQEIFNPQSYNTTLKLDTSTSAKFLLTSSKDNRPIVSFSFQKELSTGRWLIELWKNLDYLQSIWSRSIEQSKSSEREIVAKMLEITTGEKPSSQLLEVYD